MVPLIEGAKFCCHSAGLWDNYIDFISALRSCWYACQGQEGMHSVSLSQVTLRHPPKRGFLHSYHWTAMERGPWLATHQWQGLFVERQKGIFPFVTLSLWPKGLPIVLCWPRTTHCSFPKSKWMAIGFRVWSTMMQYILPFGSSPPFLFIVLCY